jgi:hypothetical protein
VSFHNKAPEHISEALLPALGALLETSGSLTRRIREYDRKLEAIAKEQYPETEHLRPSRRDRSEDCSVFD